MTAHRAQRVADEILRALARLVREELRDPRVGFVTLTGVSLAPDLKHARVFVSFLAQAEPELALVALNHAVPFLRRALSREVDLRFTPELKFLLDPAIESSNRLEEIFRSMSRAEDEDPGEPPAGTEAG